MAPAHQMFRIERDEPVPSGEGVKIPVETLPNAAIGDSVMLVQRGTDGERNGEIIDAIDEDGTPYLVVQFAD